MSLALTSVTSVLTTLLLTLVVLVDLALAAALASFKDSSTFAVSFPSLREGESVLSVLDGSAGVSVVEVEAYDFSLDPCMPSARQSPVR